MPATKSVNFLNDSDGSSLFDFATAAKPRESAADDDNRDGGDVELGCKVIEVNRVLYQGGAYKKFARIRAPSNDHMFNASVWMWSIYILLVSQRLLGADPDSSH